MLTFKEFLAKKQKKAPLCKRTIKEATDQYTHGENAGIATACHILRNVHNPRLVVFAVQDVYNVMRGGHPECPFAQGFTKIINEQIVYKETCPVHFKAKETLANLKLACQLSVPFAGLESSGMIVEYLEPAEIYLR